MPLADDYQDAGILPDGSMAQDSEVTQHANAGDSIHTYEEDNYSSIRCYTDLIVNSTQTKSSDGITFSTIASLTQIEALDLSSLIEGRDDRGVISLVASGIIQACLRQMLSL